MDEIFITTQEENKLIEKSEKFKFLQLRLERLKSMTVEIDGKEYTANRSSQQLMTSSLALANWYFNKSLAATSKQILADPEVSDTEKAIIEKLSSVFNLTYSAVYKNTSMSMETVTGELTAISLETLGQALYDSTKEVENILKGLEDV